MPLSKPQQERFVRNVCIRCEAELATKYYCRKCSDLKNAAVLRFKKKNPERSGEIKRNYKLRKISKGCLSCGGELATKYYCRHCADKENDRVRKWYSVNAENHKARVRERYYANPNREPRRYSSHPEANVPLSEFYPYGSRIDECELMVEIQNIVPKNISEDVRPDICQEIALRIISGKFDRDHIEKSISQIKKEQSRFLPSRFTRSLDQMEDWQKDRLVQKSQNY